MSTASIASALLLDPWLGEQLECDAYRLGIDAAQSDAADIAATIADLGAISSRPLFAWGRVPVAHVSMAHALETQGFRVVDTNVMLECDSDALEVVTPSSDVRIRAARPDDERQVAALAGHAFEFSRFHLDPMIPRRTADVIKVAWARNYFRGRRGNAMFVAECQDAGVPRIAGFLLAISPPGSDALTIDLVAVEARFRGRGVAAAMTSSASGLSRSIRRLRVGTQIANPPALRCYQRIGFQIVSAEYVLHYHRAPDSQLTD